MEIIDIYDENHEYQGNCEKELAHKLGLWHEVFNAIFVNKERNTIIFQIKNCRHNGIYDEDKIEITVGGHYKAGEKIEDGIREIEEETGKIIDFKELIYLGERQISLKINDNYKVREFQKMFIVPFIGKVEELKSIDDEVKAFIELDIGDGIELFLNKVEYIYGNTSYGKSRRITLSDFPKPYLKGDELLLKLLILAKRFTDGESVELLKC